MLFIFPDISYENQMFSTIKTTPDSGDPNICHEGRLTAVSKLFLPVHTINFRLFWMCVVQKMMMFE